MPTSTDAPADATSEARSDAKGEEDSSSPGELYLIDRLKEQLDSLNEDEQNALANILVRGTRDREELGPVDEVSLLANALKSDPETDDWKALAKAEEKVGPDPIRKYPDAERIELPKEMVPIDDSLAETIQERSSGRDYSGEPLTLPELSTLLFLGYGVRDMMRAYNRPDMPKRTVPTSGGLQCAEIYVVVNAVEDIEKGLYHYHPVDHALERINRGNLRWKIEEVCPQQEWITNAGVMLFIAPVLDRVKWKYRRKAYRMTHVDTGIVTHNLHLVATGLDLESCMVMGYQDEDASEFLELDGRSQFTVLALTVGRKMPVPSRRG
jgi:SagB-type dehydrogenase family enzyme